MELAVFAPGTTELGANKHCKLLGRPEQLSATALSTGSDCGVTLTVTVFELPALSVIVGALKFRVNPPLLVLQCTLACTPDEIWFVMLGLPTA